MSENFELVQPPFLHGLNSLSSSQQSHVAQQSRRDKLRIAAPQISPSQISPNFVVHAQDIEESRYSVVPRSQYPGLSGIGSLIPLQDPSGMMMDFRSSSQAFPPTKEGDDHSGWKSLNSQSNADYLINYLQNQGTQNSVVSPTVLCPVGGGGGVPILYSTTGPSMVNHGGTKSHTELTIPRVFTEGSMQRNPANQSQILASHMPPELMIMEHSQGILVPSFGNLQSGFCDWNQTPGSSQPDPKGQGLSLSLSFHNPQEQMHMQGSRFPGQNSFSAIHGLVREEKQKEKEGFAGEPSSLSKEGTRWLSAGVQRNLVPLGPFTGYASVLKNSEFLKPAHMLLDECCNAERMKIVLGSLSESGDAGKFMLPTKIPAKTAGINIGVSGVHRILTTANPPCVSSNYSGLPLANTAAVHQDPGSSADCNKHRRKKNRLVSMLDEVCRRYRHYYQQLQMVVTSFESVAGLSTAAPYTSMAVKAMTKHFRCLKSAINEHLKSTRKLLGEDCFPSSSSPVGRDHGGDRTPGLRLQDQEDMRGNYGEDWNVAKPPPQQQVWRPQRGLPERAVSVLRAWLFEHFLHPYPTDTDKQMLARQTGLTRNQVSNWFINARVRLWKPMVEEIHSLETRTSSLMDLNAARTNAGPPVTAQEDISTERIQQGQLNFDERTENHPYNGDGDSSETLQNVIQPIKRSRSGFPPMLAGYDGSGGESSYPPPTEVFSDLTGHVRTAAGGFGGVSLTLGLHHNGIGMATQNAQNRHRLGVVEDHHQDGHNRNAENVDTNEMYAMGGMDSMQMRNRVGGQLLHDFVG